MGRKYPVLNSRQLDRRLRKLGCQFLRQSGSHRHYSNPFNPKQIITYADHPGDVPRGIVAAIIEDLELTKEQFYEADFP